MDPDHRHATTLLASDLDGTLLPVAPDPSYPDAVEHLHRLLAERTGLRLAYVTGRSLAGALAAVGESGLPRPDVLGCDVGTRLYWRDGDGWRLDENFHARALDAMDGVRAEEILQTIVDGTRFRAQAAERQSDVKASFRLPVAADDDEQLEAARELVKEKGWLLSLIASRCVFSGELLLDVLPGGVDKATAVHAARKALGLKPDQVVYAGDSGNDLTALTAGFRAIVVGNAAPGLADLIRRFAEQEGRPGSVHAAAGHHLHGVLEGARRFGVL